MLRFMRPKGALAGVQPLFPLGCPRSGTTFLAELLNAHPQILMTVETAVILQLNDLITNSRRGAQAGLLYGKEHHELWADHLAAHTRALIEGYYAKIAAVERKRRLRYWGEKHPHHSHCLGFITQLYPEARYIYLVRDPRDAALSFAKMLGIGFAEGLQGWKLFTDNYEPFVATMRDERLLVLRYEDLVADYSGRARRLFAWLDLPYAVEVENFLVQYRNVDAHRLLAPEPQRVDFLAQSVGRWRRKLTDDEKAYARELVGDYLDKYGYEV